MIINNDAIKIFSQNVMYLRKSHNITKKEMAKILGIGINSLNKLEQGILPPRLSVKILFRAKNYFGISLSDQLSVTLWEKHV